MEKEIRKALLQNALKFEGKANPKAIIGTLLGKFPELRKDPKALQVQINDIAVEVNKLSQGQQQKELEKYGPIEVKEKKVQQRVKDLPNAEINKVVLRIAPSPSGPLHVGHAYVLGLSHALAQKYQGKQILRIEDTNPENIYEPAYKLIEQDAQWLTSNNQKEIIIQSDRIKTYYDYAEKLVAKAHAYVCTCTGDKFRELASKKQACPCRELETKEQLHRWDRMFLDFQPGEAVLRIKTDIQHKNPALRDWPAMRINEHEHPRQGTTYRVWPLMNFAVAIDDHELGITHTVRGKDHKDNEKKQNYLYKYLGWTPPTHVYVGRVHFQGLKISASEAKKQIQYGHYTGWDDIRLPFLPSFRKRGYQPQAFIELALDLGLTETDKKVAQEEFYKLLNAHNKKCIEKEANRYFAIKDPVTINIKNAPTKKVTLDLHPQHRKGGRELILKEEIVVEKKDVENSKDGDMIRLMDAYNIMKKENEWHYHSDDYQTYKQHKGKIIHYLPKEHKAQEIHIVQQDGQQIMATAEQGIGNTKEGEIIQIERYAFIRLENKKKMRFYYLHS